MSAKSLPFEKTIVIIPTYNESQNVQKMMEALRSVSADLSILVVDDNSPDGTAQVVEKKQQEDNKIHLLKRLGKLGLGTAYVEGFRYALENEFDFVFEMDCDFSHDPKDIPLMLEAAQNSDLVIGSRYVGGIRIVNWPLRRLLLSSFASWYTRFLTGMPLSDGMGGFKCFTRQALQALNFDNVFSGGYSFQMELNYRLWAKGKKIVEVPIIFYERRDGESKMDFRVIFEAVLAPFKLRLGRLFKRL